MPEFPNKKFKNSTELCETILNQTGVAMLPASDFGFNPKKMLTSFPCKPIKFKNNYIFD